MTDPEMQTAADGAVEIEIEANEQDIAATVVNLTQSTAQTIKAEQVRMSQGGAEKVIAAEVELKQGGANRIEAQHVQLSQGAAGLIRAAEVTLEEGGAGIIHAETATLRGSTASLVFSNTATLEPDANVGILVARQVNAEKIQAKLLLAGHVEGPVETLLDTRRALLAGLSAGVVVGAFLLMGQLFSPRKA